MENRYLKTLTQLTKRVKSEPPTKYLWGGIKEGSFGFVYGPSKSGKTTFCEGLAMSLASGKKSYFDNILTGKRKNVLFLSLEEYYKERTLRNIKQLEFLKLESLDNYNTVDENFPRLISGSVEWELLKSIIIDSGSEIVFIDSFSRLYSGSIEESSLAKNIMFKLRELTNDLKITLIIIHHTPKLNGRPITIDSLAGSRILAQDADFLIGINKSVNGTRYLKEVAYRYAPENSDTVTSFTIDKKNWLVVSGDIDENDLAIQADGRVNDFNTDKVLNVIKELTKDGDEVKSKDIEKEGEIVGVKRATVYNQLKKLEEKKIIRKVKQGVYVLCKTT